MIVLDHPLPSDKAQAMLKALADPLRLKLVQTLAGKEHCVCDLTDALGQAQSKLSFHLKVLKEAGLLLDRQEGRWIHYRLNASAFQDLESWLSQDLPGKTEGNCTTGTRRFFQKSAITQVSHMT